MKTTVAAESEVYISLIGFFIFDFKPWLFLIFLCFRWLCPLTISNIVKIFLNFFLHLFGLDVAGDGNNRIFIKIVVLKIFKQICVLHLVYIFLGTTYIPT